MTRDYLNVALVVLIGLGAIGCSKSETPEQRVRALLVSAEEAAENKEIAKLRGLLSERYRDDDGRDRRAIESVLRLYLLRHEEIHLSTRIESVISPQPQRAEAVLYAAIAARPIKTQDALRNFKAQLYRFELSFVEEKKHWRVVRAAWRPAELTDFFP